MRHARPVLIAGGGIAGLALALGLARRGIASHLLERRPQFSEAGAGIQLGPNGVHALDALGVRDGLAQLAGRPPEIRVFRARSGALLQRLPLGDWIEARHGAPYLVVHRQDLQAALLAAVRAQSSIQITTGFAVAAIAADADSVHVRSTDGQRQSGTALIGADGVFSAVRRHLHPGRAPVFAGRTAARAVIPAGIAKSPLFGDATGVWLAPKAHVVHYPVRGGADIAIVVIREETWAEQGWNAPVTWETLEAALHAFTPALRAALRDAPEWRRWALFDAPPLPAWSHGPVGLIGDAAHPILPFLAQGGSLALEDAATLAGLMATHRDDVPAAFRALEAARKMRTTKVAALARQNGRIYHLDGIAAGVRDLGLRALPPARVMARYEWIYGWRP